MRQEAIRDAGGNVWVKERPRGPWLLWGADVWLWDPTERRWQLLRRSDGSPPPEASGECAFRAFRRPNGAVLAGLQRRPGRLQRINSYNVASGRESLIPSDARETPVSDADRRRLFFGDRPFVEGPPPRPPERAGERRVLLHGTWPSFCLYHGPSGVHAYSYNRELIRVDKKRNDFVHWPDLGMYNVLTKSWPGADRLMVRRDRALGYSQALFRAADGRYAFVGDRIVEFSLHDAGDPILRFYTAWTPCLEERPMALSRERAYFPMLGLHVPRAWLTDVSTPDKRASSYDAVFGGSSLQALVQRGAKRMR